MTTTKLSALLHLVDPTLPIGGFNHSAGLETYVQQGVIHNKASLDEYLRVQLQQNWVYNDGAYASLAYDACQNNDFDALLRLDHHAAASKSAREIREASAKLGSRLLKIFIRHHHHPLLKRFQTALNLKQVQGFYAIVFGILAAVETLSKSDMLEAFYYNAAVGTITNGVKLIPLSQMDGQDILFALRADLQQAVTNSLTPEQEWLGVACISADIRAMQHERLYTRLYMS